MQKTNKELATELTITFIESWNSKQNTTALKLKDSVDILEAFWEALTKMDSKSNND